MIYIASDHGGFELKNKIINFLSQKGFTVNDMGPSEYNEGDDYPDFVVPLAREVVKNVSNRGIVICKNGVGVSVSANRFKNIRATLSWNSEHARSSRLDDDSNVLALPAQYIDDATAFGIVETWLSTDFSAEPRHIRRIKKVENL